MQFLIIVRPFETIVGPLAPALQKEVGLAIQRVVASGKMAHGGVIVDGRGCYMVLNINDTSELFDLFGASVYDSCSIEIHPLTTFEKLGELFAKQQGK